MEPQPRYQFFTGKGGVGKSTVCLATAIEASRRGATSLVVSLGQRALPPSDPEHPQTHPAKHTPPKPVEAHPGVWLVSLDFEQSLFDYLKSSLRVGALARRLFGSAAFRLFANASPGVFEIVSLHALRRFDAYDFIFVDLDATGHAEMFLGLPRMLRQLASERALRRMIRPIETWLSNPKESVLHIVTLPQEFAAHEAEHIYRSTRHAGQISLGRLFVNMTPTFSLTPHEQSLCAELLTEPERTHLVNLAQREQRAFVSAQAWIERLRTSVPLPTTRIPLVRPAPAPGHLAEVIADHLNEAPRLASPRSA